MNLIHKYNDSQCYSVLSITTQLHNLRIINPFTNQS